MYIYNLATTSFCFSFGIQSQQNYVLTQVLPGFHVDKKNKILWRSQILHKNMQIMHSLTRELIVDKLRETGVIPPPEKPKLPATPGLVPSPHTQHICSQASAETTQDGVLLSREQDGRRGGSLPHKTPPFYSGQISLKEDEEEVVRKLNTKGNEQIPTPELCISNALPAWKKINHSIYQNKEDCSNCLGFPRILFKIPFKTQVSPFPNQF